MTEPQHRHVAPGDVRRTERGIEISMSGYLPFVCAKCATRENVHRWPRSFLASTAGSRFVGAINPLSGLLLQKHADFDVPICARCKRRWKVTQRLSIVAFIVALVAPFSALFLAFQVVEAEWALATFTLVFFGSLLGYLASFLLHRMRALRATAIAGGFITLRGLHPDFEAALFRSMREHPPEARVPTAR